jgi:DNA polymerase III subunit delta'
MGFDNIVGHDRQKSMLLSLLGTGNLPQAFLFSGQKGIGKRKLALETAKYLFCEHGTACGQCRACVNVDRGSHPDLVIVQGETSIGIDQSRMLGKEISEYPYEGDRRAIIIDEAEIMTTEAANALLKTLEEPPPYNTFFLVTSSQRDIPLTILSRCARVTFSPLGKDALGEYFTRFFKGDKERGGLFSHISYGSIGCGLFWSQEEHFALRRRLGELVTGKERSFTAATLFSEKAGKSAESASMYLSFLLSFLGDLYVATMERDNSRVVNIDIRDLVEWENVDARWISRSIAKVQETFRMMRYNVSRWLLFESLLMQIMR